MTQQSKYPWTYGGRELLAEVENMIEYYGGYPSLITAIEKENRPPYKIKRHTHFWSDSEELFLIKNHHKMYHEEIAERLNKTDHSVKYKIKCFYRDGLLTHIMPKRSRGKSAC